jgi:hypothetical protein
MPGRSGVNGVTIFSENLMPELDDTSVETMLFKSCLLGSGVKSNAKPTCEVLFKVVLE